MCVMLVSQRVPLNHNKEPFKLNLNRYLVWLNNVIELESIKNTTLYQ